MSNSCCSGFDAAELENQQRRVLTIVLLINVITFFIMVTGAYISGSSALLSGTLDNFGDALTYGLSIAVIGASIAAKARVALVKGLLIFIAAMAVVGQIIWRLFNPETPLFAAMGLAALLNLGANAICLWLLYPHRENDINMSSVWECSRNDVFEGLAVVVATLAVWTSSSGWPDLLIASALVVLFLRSSIRILREAWQELGQETKTSVHESRVA
ncbi:MAG: cation transporter [Pseudomonadales bacterium]|nr:cation transporter [Pseudomonadales bacterium]